MTRRRLCFLAMWAGVVLLMAATPLLAQETSQETAAFDAVTRWKVINTAIFALGLGYFLWKFAPAFFNARSADIQKAIKDATGLKIEADFRYSEMDRKMATLGEEVKRIRDQFATEMEREHERITRETQRELEHIRHSVAVEAEAFRQEGMQKIRLQTAQLAVQAAERRLRERFASDSGDDLVHDFIHLVERGKN